VSTPSDSPSDSPSTTGPATPTDGGPMWSLGEAARNTGRAETTLRAALRAGTIPGATYDDKAGRWSIPLAGLIAAGHLPKVSPATGPVAEPSPLGVAPSMDFETAMRMAGKPPFGLLTSNEAELIAEVERLRTELAAARTLAEERARSTEAALAHAADLRAALDLLARALPAGTTEPASPATLTPEDLRKLQPRQSLRHRFGRRGAR